MFAGYPGVENCYFNALIGHFDDCAIHILVYAVVYLVVYERVRLGAQVSKPTVRFASTMIPLLANCLVYFALVDLRFEKDSAAIIQTTHIGNLGRNLDLRRVVRICI